MANAKQLGFPVQCSLQRTPGSPVLSLPPPSSHSSLACGCCWGEEVPSEKLLGEGVGRSLEGQGPCLSVTPMLRDRMQIPSGHRKWSWRYTEDGTKGTSGRSEPGHLGGGTWRTAVGHCADPAWTEAPPSARSLTLSKRRTGHEKPWAGGGRGVSPMRKSKES